MLEVYRSALGDGWVASYLHWTCERACPIAAVAAVMAFEVQSLGVADVQR